MKPSLRALAITLLAAALPAAAADTNAPAAAPGSLPFRNPDLPLAQRVADLVGRLTLEEKIGLLEVETVPIPRLDIASRSWWGEAIHGVARAGRATMFPQVIGQAATWNPPLIHRMAVVISDEARGKYRENPEGRYRSLNFWAPAADLVRDPRWGRAQETYGEDPLLVGQMVVAFIRGMQGDDPRYLKTAASVKHFGMHSQETDRTGRSFPIGERPLYEYYFQPFQKAFRESGVAGCMAAHNGVNGVPCHANAWLLTDIVRGQWGFRGPVFTDWCGTSFLMAHHHYVTNLEKAVQATIQAGVDVMSERKSIASNVVTAVTNGLIRVADLDQAVARAMTLRFRVGEFDPPERVPYTKIDPSIVGRPEHVALAREIARQSIVLLQNQPVPGRPDAVPLLPLPRDRLESVAVLGPYASLIYFGTYPSEPAAPPVGVLQGVRAQLGDHVLVRTAPWYDHDEQEKLRKRKQPALDREECLQSALRAAADADVAIVALGLWRKHEYEGKDRQDLDLPQDQQEFVEKIRAVNPAVVVVLFSGTPLTINWIAGHVPAVLEAWLPGEQGGAALADVLFGEVSPAGRLPMTFYATLEGLPPLEVHELNPDRTYQYLRTPPLWPFGHGLSYTWFDYANLRIEPDHVPTNGTVRVSFDVINTGDRDGDEVAQVYVRDVAASVPVPLRRLRGFQRISVARGRRVPVSITIPVAELGFWDERRHGWVIEPGAFAVEVGASSADLRLCGEFTVE